MLSDEVLDKVVERLARRMEQANTNIIKMIGKSIKKIGTLTPSEAHELVQILKYGGDYDKIINELTKATKLNVKDIKKIFRSVAKTNYQFSEQFYKYRNIKFIPFDENKVLNQQINAIANATAKEFVNLTQTSAVALGKVNKDGSVSYKALKKAYYDLLDEAVLNVGQGKETFESAMYRQLKEIGNGVKVIFPTTYIDKDGIERNRTMRLDSAIRMQMKSALRDMNNQMQQDLGKEFNADGVEVSVHLNPAPDHELVQGKQFSNKEFEKFQNDEIAVSYDGIEFPAISEETGHDRRSIGQYNCYHKIFSIVLGVSKPLYTNEQLQEIIDDAHKTITFDEKEYTMYEATQLQRKLELEIRKAKDNQILGRSSGNEKLIYESQEKITLLNQKYKDLLKATKLPNKVNRMRVSGYKRVATNYTSEYGPFTDKEISSLRSSKVINAGKSYEEWEELLKEKNIIFSTQEFKKNYMNEELMSNNFEQLNNLVEKYPRVKESIKDTELSIHVSNTEKAIASTNGYELNYSRNHFQDPQKYMLMQYYHIKRKWHSEVPISKLPVYTTTHEFGHILENRYIKYFRKNEWAEFSRQTIDNKIMNEIYLKAMFKTETTITKLKEMYLSNYGKSKRNFEAFAEIFTKMELGKKDPLTEAMAEYLEEIGWKMK